VKQKAERGDYIFDEKVNVYLVKHQTVGQGPNLAYCARCLNKENKAVPMGWRKETKQYICSACNFANCPPTLGTGAAPFAVG
jgi:hypothetical protein